MTAARNHLAALAELRASARCATCGAAMRSEGYRNCAACRRCWRDAKRKAGGRADTIDAARDLLAALDELHANGALRPTGFPRLQSAMLRMRRILAER